MPPSRVYCSDAVPGGVVGADGPVGDHRELGAAGAAGQAVRGLRERGGVLPAVGIIQLGHRRIVSVVFFLKYTLWFL